MIDKINAGIDLITKNFGELYAGRTYLLAGEKDTAKTTFVLQYLYQGLKEGNTCLLVANQPPRDLVIHAEVMGMDLTPYFLDGTLLVYETVRKEKYPLVPLFQELEKITIQTVGNFKDYNAIAAENRNGVPVLADTGSGYFLANKALFGVGVQTDNVDGGPFLDVAESMVRIAVGLKKAELIAKGLRPEEIKKELIAFLLKMGLSEDVVTFDPNGRHLIVNRSALLQQIVREYQATVSVDKAA